MNQATKSVITAISRKLNGIASDLRDIESQEQETFDNMTENAQESERGEALSQAIDQLSTAAAAIKEAESALDDIV